MSISERGDWSMTWSTITIFSGRSNCMVAWLSIHRRLVHLVVAQRQGDEDGHRQRDPQALADDDVVVAQRAALDGVLVAVDRTSGDGAGAAGSRNDGRAARVQIRRSGT